MGLTKSMADYIPACIAFKGLILAQDDTVFWAVPPLNGGGPINGSPRLYDMDIYKFKTERNGGECFVTNQMWKLNVSRLKERDTHSYTQGASFCIIPAEWDRWDSEEKYRTLTGRCLGIAETVRCHGEKSPYAFVLPETIDETAMDALSESIGMSVGEGGRSFIVSDGIGYKQRLQFAIEQLGSMCETPL